MPHVGHASACPVLECRLQCELNLARRVRIPNRAECGVAGLGVRNPEVGVIQDIEEFRAELQPHGLAHAEGLVDAVIPLPEAGSAESVTAQIAEFLAGRSEEHTSELQ